MECKIKEEIEDDDYQEQEIDMDLVDGYEASDTPLKDPLEIKVENKNVDDKTSLNENKSHDDESSTAQIDSSVFIKEEKTSLNENKSSDDESCTAQIDSSVFIKEEKDSCEESDEEEEEDADITDKSEKCDNGKRESLEPRDIDVDFPVLPEMIGTSDDWTYTMRRSMQEIIPGVYLGPYSAAMKKQYQTLRDHGITHIICVRHKLEAHYIRPNFPDDFRYLVLEIADSLTENIIQHFPLASKFIEECLNGGGKILVHGNAGISRSAALVLAYIMEKYGLSVRKAFQIVQQRRFCINPNEGFMAQLLEFEPIYRAHRSVLQNGQTSAELSHRNKRPLECIDDR